MKKFAKWLAVVTLVLGLALCYLLVGTRLTVRLIGVVVTPAAEEQERFDTVMHALVRGDYGAMQRKTPQSTAADDFSFVDVTVSASNIGLVPAEWCLVNVSSGEGDILLIYNDPVDIPAFGGAEMTATLLVENENIAYTRDAWLEYYVLGRPHSADAE